MRTTRYRSFLFVPADNDRLLQSAVAKPCDVIILDLEDGTHPSRKASARATLHASIERVKEAGKTAAVRVNGDLDTAVTDLRVAVSEGLDMVLLPKVEHPRDVQLLSGLVAALEASAGIAAGRVRFLLQIESAAALPRLHEIAAADARTMGMMLGSEDFSLDCGALPTPEALMQPSLMVLHAARAARIQAIGFVGSIADLGDVAQFAQKLDQARSFGFRGAVVVHPKFLDAVNACYTPSPEALAEAREVVAAFESGDAEGIGAMKVNGKMIDKPVYRRALELIAEAD
ncbi:HpcH/HpaI aldolase/citrate lyase family protein [Variovorax ginsengisoli]|uniref:CoA ester lyase n=1 Tax=Variovorax ginsengisoli TaxID=363844 RepID=A0ABT8RWZ8_9BURK|nr:CoA ester lyase [Variovorax ginsengisoli]MDN8611989.1 CoA ester lyase [Variovorax ginsengisoli]MDO1531159.1 CoA ester lyase [Variovorax ginsengisoli]